MSGASKKNRIDALLVERGLVRSREQGRRLIMAGEVLADGEPVTKPGQQIDSSAAITIRQRPRYVSRGGEKLEHALAAFNLTPQGRVCADVGASTGGFTDCLLQHGAVKVYAIDVGYGQLAWKLRQDDRVVVMERVNARYLEQLPELVDAVVVDASFISLGLLLPVIRTWLTPTAWVVALVKPQFEAGRSDVGKGGVVRDPEVHRRVLVETIEFADTIGLHPFAVTCSPITGPKGNIEFLIGLKTIPPDQTVSMDAAIQTALSAAQKLIEH